MKVIKIFALFVIMFISFWSCKEKMEQAANEETPENIVEEKEALPDDFMAFYDQFGADSVFQMEHIVFPLDGEKALSESGVAGIHLTKWQKEDWKMQRTFNDMDGTFQREFISFHGIVSEAIQDKSGEFSMLRRFSKIGDQWMLIFYQEMGKH